MHYATQRDAKAQHGQHFFPTYCFIKKAIRHNESFQMYHRKRLASSQIYKIPRLTLTPITSFP